MDGEDMEENFTDCQGPPHQQPVRNHESPLAQCPVPRYTAIPGCPTQPLGVGREEARGQDDSPQVPQVTKPPYTKHI